MAQTKNISASSKGRKAKIAQDKRKEFFDDLVAGIRTQELKHDTGVASAEEHGILELMMNPDIMAKAAALSHVSERLVLEEMVTRYIGQTKKLNPLLKKHILFYNQRGKITTWMLVDFNDRLKLSGEVLKLEADFYREFSDYRFQIEINLVDTKMNVFMPESSQGIDLLSQHES